MKRSRSIRLVLTGAVASATFVGCGTSDDSPPLSAEQSYTNNHYVHGAGYYHAPYARWYPYPYNHYAPGQGYYYGGRWSPQPEIPQTTVSRPTPDAARLAQAQRLSSSRSRSTFSTSSRSSGSSTSTRGGFGSSSHSTAS